MIGIQNSNIARLGITAAILAAALSSTTPLSGQEERRVWVIGATRKPTDHPMSDVPTIAAACKTAVGDHRQITTQLLRIHDSAFDLEGIAPRPRASVEPGCKTEDPALVRRLPRQRRDPRRPYPGAGCPRQGCWPSRARPARASAYRPARLLDPGEPRSTRFDRITGAVCTALARGTGICGQNSDREAREGGDATNPRFDSRRTSDGR